jgi:inner membrane protein involved in colicin E2 resistance
MDSEKIAIICRAIVYAVALIGVTMITIFVR